MSRRWDVVVVGGGHDGLACAAVLARAGRTVVLLDGAPAGLGDGSPAEIAPGFRAPEEITTGSRLRPALVRELALDRHGLSLVPFRAAWAPSPEGPGSCRWADAARTHEELASVSVRDADRYPDLVRCVAKLAAAVGPLVDDAPFDPTSRRPAELARMGAFTYGLLRGGELLPLLGVATQSVADWLAEWLETDALRAALVAGGLRDVFRGPRSPGTALDLVVAARGGLDPAGGGRCLAIGGAGAVARALARSAAAAGAEIRTDVAVERVREEGGQATGVVLEGGETVDAPIVVVARDRDDTPRARIHLALDHLPAFTGRTGTEHLAGEITIAPSVTAMDEAFVEARAGRWSRRPQLHLLIPSLLDPTLAPPDRHVMTILAAYAPPALAGNATWVEERDTFADHVLSVVEELCPGLTNAVVGRQVITPLEVAPSDAPAPPAGVSGRYDVAGRPTSGIGMAGVRCARRLLGSAS